MKRHLKHWQDGVSTLVGAWLIASPWVLGLDIHANVAAFVGPIVIGALLCACGLCEFFIPESWEEYSELYLGVLLIASPWMLEYKAALPTASTNVVACGVIVLAMAVWVLVTDEQFGWARRSVTRRSITH